ncbi:hypothetical protein Tco_1187523 [Tanacetum coccineum]
MNYVPVAAGTISTESTCIKGDLNTDASYFDSSSNDVGNDEPKSADEDTKHVEDGPIKIACPGLNTGGIGLNTGGIGLNTIGSSVNTATTKDMVGPSYSLEAPHVESLHDENDTKVDLGNILKSYAVPTTPYTRIHINHPLTNVIGDIQSSVQIRRMKEPASEQEFLSVVYDAKTHEDLYTCLFACFLSQEEPKRVSKAEAMQEELLRFKL